MRTRSPISSLSQSPSNSSSFKLASLHLLPVRLTVSIFLLVITSLSFLSSSCAKLNPINPSVAIPAPITAIVPRVGLRRRPSAFVTSGSGIFKTKNQNSRTNSSNSVYRYSAIPLRSRLKTKIMTVSSRLHLHEHECEHNQNGDKGYTIVHDFRSPFLPTKTNNLTPPPPPPNDANVNGAVNGDQNMNGCDQHQHMKEEEHEDVHILSALIILNSPMERPPSAIFDKLWEISSFRVCADGGANRLYYATVNDEDNNYYKNNGRDNGSDNDICKINNYIPDLIRGDLDSLEPHVREYYSTMEIGIGDRDRIRDNCGTGKGKVRIERDPDQNCNDLDKALNAIHDWFSATQMETQAQAQATSSILTSSSTSTKQSTKSIQIYVYGAFGGRFDQEMASIQALYRWRDEFQYNIALYTDETFAILCRPGPHVRNEIRLPFYSNMLKKEAKCEHEETEGEDKGGEGELLHVESQAEEVVDADSTEQEYVGTGEGPTVGLIPIGCMCDGVITQGFKWDLDGSIPLEFGGLVSTSNRAEDEVLIVECQQPLVFTAEITRLKVSKIKELTERMQGSEAPNSSDNVRDRI